MTFHGAYAKLSDMITDCNMKKYNLFDLNVKSDIKAPEIPEYDFEEPDVEIVHSEFSPPEGELKKYGNTIYDKKGGVIFSFLKNFGGFIVEGGNKIYINQMVEPGTAGFRFFIFGTAMALLLHQRGIITLHAGAVSIDDRVIGFVGNSGAGKSTTVASLCSKGYPFVSDDILALDIIKDRVISYPSNPYIKLDQKSVKMATEEDYNSLKKTHPSSRKKVMEVKSIQEKRNLPLEEIYVLEKDKHESENTKVSKIEGRASFMEMIKNSYSLRILGRSAISSQHFEKLSQVSKIVKTKSIKKYGPMRTAKNIIEDVESGGK